MREVQGRGLGILGLTGSLEHRQGKVLSGGGCCFQHPGKESLMAMGISNSCALLSP